MASPLQVPDDDVSIYSLVSCSAVLMAVGFFSLSWSIGLSETWRGLSEGFKWTQTYIKEQGLTWNRSQSKPLQQVLPDQQAWSRRKVFSFLSCSHPLLFVFQWQSCGIGKEDEMKSARKHRRLVWLPSVNLADLPPKHTRCVSLVSWLMQFLFQLCNHVPAVSEELSLLGVFYFENWARSLCLFCVWLPVLFIDSVELDTDKRNNKLGSVLSNVKPRLSISSECKRCTRC